MDADTRLDRLAALIASSPHNLVSASQRTTVRDTHIAEAAAIAAVLPAGAGQTWIDLGTGGGLPGLVCAAIQPSVRWMLIDASRKKIDAVTGFAAELVLPNVTAVWGRAEVLAHDRAYRGQADGVVSRAVAPLPTLLELARGFLRRGGWCVAVKGPSADDEIAASEGARAILGFGPVHRSGLLPTVRPTIVVSMRARTGVPPGYPRRDGLPSTNPL